MLLLRSWHALDVTTATFAFLLGPVDVWLILEHGSDLGRVLVFSVDNPLLTRCLPILTVEISETD